MLDPSASAPDRGAMHVEAAYASICASARRLASTVEPIADEADAASHVHETVRRHLRDSGLCQLAVPSAYGGQSETVDPLAITLVRQILMGTSAQLDSLFGMQGVGSYALGLAGVRELKQAWLPRVASLDAIAALALTEPHVGSDLRAITTTVQKSGDNLVVNGVKAFITNAGAAAFYSVLAREGEGYSLIFIPADAGGLCVRSGPEIIAPHVLGEVHLTDVTVPETHRLGAPGDGFKLALATLAVFRTSVAGAAVGLGEAALDEAVRHAREREQFGVPLWKLGAVGESLARCWADLEAARAVTLQAAQAAQIDAGANLDRSSIAKLIATETAGTIVDRCVQVMGRFGLVRGEKMERLYRNARPMRIYEGSTEVILNSLARRLVSRAG